MAEATATAIGIASILSIAKDVVGIAGSLAQYFQNVKLAEKHISSLLEEVRASSEVLQGVELLLNDPEQQELLPLFEPTSTLRKALAAYKASLQALSEKLARDLEQGGTAKSLRGSIGRAVHRLKWPFQENEFAQVLEGLRNCARLFEFGLTVEGCRTLAKPSTDVARILRRDEALSNETQKILRLVTSLQSIPGDLKAVQVLTQSFHVRASDERFMTMLIWLSPLSM